MFTGLREWRTGAVAGPMGAGGDSSLARGLTEAGEFDGYSKKELLASQWKNVPGPGGTIGFFDPPVGPVAVNAVNASGQWLVQVGYDPSLPMQGARPAVLDDSGLRYPFGSTQGVTLIDLNESGAVLGAIWDDDFTTTHALLSTVDGGVTRFERTSAAG
ncbi:MAG: hypothetical protein ABIX28_17995, partial [Vicinamibacterales bacterium]